MSGPNGEPNISIDDDDDFMDDEEDLSEGEYAAINSMLDQINSCLDDLEERNDSLNGKLHELLESNRQARQEFRAQLNGSDPPGEDRLLPEKEDSSPNQEEGESG